MADMLKIVSGICPVKLLFSRTRYSRFCRLPIPEGISPDRVQISIHNFRFYLKIGMTMAATKSNTLITILVSAGRHFSIPASFFIQRIMVISHLFFAKKNFLPILHKNFSLLPFLSLNKFKTLKGNLVFKSL